ncbi:MAG: DUF3553 domain-containing protein [Nitrospirae bacterium]|nr:DUF3553 domain-containing protein [Nitrospirota bacterium]
MLRRLYLKLGDRVTHMRYSVWGVGEVIEEKHSSLSGGLCIVRIIFEDGNERSFINDMDSECCCYYSGIRIVN